MSTLSDNAEFRSRQMIELISASDNESLAEKNTCVTIAYIVSIHELGLITRVQFEILTVKSELALGGWKSADAREKCARARDDF